LRKLRWAARYLNCSVFDLEGKDQALIDSAATAYVAEKDAEVARIKAHSKN